MRKYGAMRIIFVGMLLVCNVKASIKRANIVGLVKHIDGLRLLGHYRDTDFVSVHFYMNYSGPISGVVTSFESYRRIKKNLVWLFANRA